MTDDPQAVMDANVIANPDGDNDPQNWNLCQSIYSHCFSLLSLIDFCMFDTQTYYAVTV